MIYEAKYGEDGYDAAIMKAASWIADDTYYRAPHGVGQAAQARDKYGWMAGCSGLKPNDERAYAPKKDEIKEFWVIQWMSCTGNLARFTFNHSKKEVILLIEARRHGIPDIGAFYETSGRPTAILRYVTQEPTWEWWENADTHSNASFVT